MEKQSCENCRHFTPFYRKRLTELVPVNFGTCRKKTLAQNRKQSTFNRCCEKWEPKEQSNERREEIKTVIQKMQKHLEQIAILLQNENEP